MAITTNPQHSLTTDPLLAHAVDGTPPGLELTRVAVHCITTLLPEASSVIALLADGDRAQVIETDSSLRGAATGSFAADQDSLLRTAFRTGQIVRAPLTAQLRRQLPWSRKLGERKSRLTCLRLSQIDSHAVIMVFHRPESIRLVDDALRSLSTLLSEPSLTSSPDPAIYAVISKAKREWERTVDALDQLVLLLDRKGRVVRANRTVERWELGSVGDLRGLSMHAVLHPRCKDRQCRLERLLGCSWKHLCAEGPSSFEFLDPLLGRELEVTLQPIAAVDGPQDLTEASFAVVVVKDVTELHQTQRQLRELNDALELRVRERTEQLQTRNRDLGQQIKRCENAEHELEDSRDELARLSAELLKAQESERRRIALELHDSVGQSLGALKYSLERVVAINQDPGLGDASQTLDAAIDQLRRAIHDTRTISMSLRPSVLDDMGAVSAVKWLCRWFHQTYSNIHVISDCQVTDAEIPEHLAAPLFRITQEALNNVAKHSSAHNVLVMLRRAGNLLSLEVRDDGVGFDTKAVKVAAPHLGIIGMRERASMTGGRFSVVSGPDVSTQVRVEWDFGS